MKKIVLVIGVILLMFAFTAEAADKKDVKQKKATNKCWKKMPPLEKELMSPEYNTVCTAFEEVLNKTCESPEKLKCNWTLPEGEKKFKKLEWQQLDPKEYRKFIEEIFLGEAYTKNPNPDFKKKLWDTTNPEFKKAFEEDNLDIRMAIVDIDHDGKTEQLIRYNWRPNCPALLRFGVINPEIKQIDWRYKHLLYINSGYGGEIMIYNGDGKAYMFNWPEIPGFVMVYEGFNLLPNNDRRGSINICRFQYLKGGKKQ